MSLLVIWLNTDLLERRPHAAIFMKNHASTNMHNAHEAKLCAHTKNDYLSSSALKTFCEKIGHGALL